MSSVGISAALSSNQDAEQAGVPVSSFVIALAPNEWYTTASYT